MPSFTVMLSTLFLRLYHGASPCLKSGIAAVSVIGEITSVLSLTSQLILPFDSAAAKGRQIVTVNTASNAAVSFFTVINHTSAF